jgi:hypothetical protein
VFRNRLRNVTAVSAALLTVVCVGTGTVTHKYKAWKKPAATSTSTPSTTSSASPTTDPAAPSSTSSTATSVAPVATSTTTSTTSSAVRTPSRTVHYGYNIGANLQRAQSFGIDVIDIAGSTTNPVGVKARVDALPSGAQAMVWVGNLDNARKGSPCPAPGFNYDQFKAQVKALAGDKRVFGYYLSDEPHPSACPHAASDIRARADYIRSVAPTQKSFIVVLDGTSMCNGTLGCEYSALSPAKTHVDLIGLDPYPCSYDSAMNPVRCNLSAITAKVTAAIANGIPAAQIAPVFQTFGQEGRTDGKTVYYRTPSASELQSMLDVWQALVPNPVLDAPYTFGIQCKTSTCPAPQALENHPELQQIITAHNTR